MNVKWNLKLVLVIIAAGCLIAYVIPFQDLATFITATASSDSNGDDMPPMEIPPIEDDNDEGTGDGVGDSNGDSDPTPPTPDPTPTQDDNEDNGEDGDGNNDNGNNGDSHYENGGNGSLIIGRSGVGGWVIQGSGSQVSVKSAQEKIRPIRGN